MFDIIIKNGTVIDGSGEPGRQEDVGIVADRIKMIGDLKKDKASTIIDATGQIVTPGFIDIQNHSDGYLTILSYPHLESYLAQGVTTIIGGQCGSSLAPLLSREAIHSVRKWADVRGVNFNWITMTEYLDEIESRGLACNFGSLVGHTTVRRGLVGDQNRDLTAEELEVVTHVITQALDEGALGCSFGLEYSHANFVKTEEILRIAKALKPYRKLITCHLRDEGVDLLDSLEEILLIAHQTGLELEISHFKAEGKSNWKKFDKALMMINKARDNGIKVNFDLYPYTVSSTALYTFLPRWVSQGGRDKMLARIKDKKQRQRIIEDMISGPFDYSDMQIASCPGDPSLSGKFINDIAVKNKLKLEEAILEVLSAGRGHAIVMDKNISEDNLKKAIAQQACIISSNGAGYNSDHGSNQEELVHPRNFGCFPRFLGRYVRAAKLMKWEEAIHVVTKKPADKIGLRGRGELKQDNKADITVFDPEKIIDKASYDNPYLYSGGVEYTIVNGTIAYAKGRFGEELDGKVIRL